jgi:hypothetical protein
MQGEFQGLLEGKDASPETSETTVDYKCKWTQYLSKTNDMHITKFVYECILIRRKNVDRPRKNGETNTSEDAKSMDDFCPLAAAADDDDDND